MGIEHLGIGKQDGMNQPNQIWLLRDPEWDFDPRQPGMVFDRAHIQIEESHPQAVYRITTPFGDDLEHRRALARVDAIAQQKPVTDTPLFRRTFGFAPELFENFEHVMQHG